MGPPRRIMPAKVLFRRLLDVLVSNRTITWNWLTVGVRMTLYERKGLPVLLPACNWVWWLLSTWATEVVLLALAFGGICADLVDGKRSRCLDAADGGDTGARSQGGESKSSCWRHLWMDLVLVVPVQVGEGGNYAMCYLRTKLEDKSRNMKRSCPFC